MLKVSGHPLLREKLTRLRDERTPPRDFRALVAEIATLLLYEATADLPLADHEVRTPLAPYRGSRLAEQVGLVPVLRAGIGMVEAALALIPEAQVWHIGLFRDERTLRPIEYYNRLPAGATAQVCLVLDPMLATGGSAVATIDILKRWGAKRVKYVGIIAAPEGVAALSAAHPAVPIHIAALDERLNEKGYILPGLGDAGDRQFGTG
ncbi:MAG: uracil phosphoribosyltransferase [Chloroflexi bacterium]|nr:uracil phosphoribosyltransferase [Chloroflexota bacterium]